MKYLISLLIITFCWAHVVSVQVSVPEYKILPNAVEIENGSRINIPGAPDLPGKIVTIALPPGAILESVEFSGNRKEIATLDLSPTQPAMPFDNNPGLIAEVCKQYKKNRERYYALNQVFPSTYGRLIENGGLRKYRIVTVACHHFAYNPESKKLFVAPDIDVHIHYRLPAPESERAQFWQGLQNDITFDNLAREIIYNWQDVRVWYSTDTPQRANGYYIIIPAALQNSVDTLVAYRANQGYDVQVITREYIEANVAGVDLSQKIRNYLRENLVDIAYVLLVGFSSDMPWRALVPFNNDPDSPYNDPDISPIPSDLYLADLSEHDTLSWNSDRDAYYGEVYDSTGQANGDDNPDYHAEIHLGRLPFSTANYIEDICEKWIAFDCNTDLSYKTASLLTGALYYYANENNGGNARLDGADFMEQLMDDGILDRSNAVYLYEKGGLRPCPYTCTDSLTRTNHVNYWQSKGIMYECHHGNYNCYARKVWAWDDGDSIPENNEITWPLSLEISDVNQLDYNYPATCFLRSCLCGKPEVYCLGGYLLYQGASAVISSSRISWFTYADPGGVPYHFYDRLMIDTLTSHGIIGDAYDLARNDFMTIGGYWVIVYHYNMFGDPALRQYGRYIGTQEARTESILKYCLVSPNPSAGHVKVQLHLRNKADVMLSLFDVSGRLVKTVIKGTCDIGEKEITIYPEGLSGGVYFVKIEIDGEVITEKVVLIN